MNKKLYYGVLTGLLAAALDRFPLKQRLMK